MLPKPAVLASPLFTALILPLVSATKYSLVEELKGNKFLSAYDFYRGPDPLGGFVQSVSLDPYQQHHPIPPITYTKLTTPFPDSST